MKRLLSHQKSEMKYSPTVQTNRSVQGRRILYDRFSVAVISNAMDISGLDYG